MKYILLLICVAALKAQWVSDPMVNTKVTEMGSNAMVKVRMDENSNSYFTWYQGNSEGNPYTFKAQKLDNTGAKVWDSAGIVLSDQPQQTWLTQYDMEIHPDGGFVAAFFDVRHGGLDIHATRVDADGNTLWGEDGISLINTVDGFNAAPKIEIDSEGNSYVGWFAEEGNGKVIVQKIDNDGNLLWGDGIYLESDEATCTKPDLKIDSEDHLFVTWSKQTGPFYSPNRNIYVQRFNPDGEPQFSEDLAITNIDKISGWLDIGFAIGSNDEVIIGWDDDRDGDYENDPYFQVVDKDGNLKFEENGRLLDGTPAYHGGGCIPSIDEAGNYLVGWWKTDVANQVDNHIVIQKFVGTEEQWDNNGKIVVTPDKNPAMLFNSTSQSNKNMFIYSVYTDDNFLEDSLLAGMYDDEGNSLWNGDDHLLIKNEASSTVHYDNTGWVNGKFVLAWEDDRDENENIYAQNINIDGTLGIGGTVEIEESEMDFALLNNYPNPFNPTTTINYQVVNGGIINLSVCNANGELVSELVKSNHKSGHYSVEFDGTDLSSGIYYYSVKGENFTATKKMVLVK